MSVALKDNKLTKLVGDLEFEITVGIHEEDNDGREGGETVAQVASYHEFGAGVPQRSFLRSYFDESESQINEFLESATESILNGDNAKAALGVAAVQIEGGVKEKILNRLSPDLSKSTKRKRGEGAVPLVDTAQTIGAIRGKVKVIK